MPKNNVTDLITDQEITFVRLVLSGTMTDRQAAEAAGLDPNSAPSIKSKPRVRAYLLEHRAAVAQQLVEQDAGELRRFNVSRDQVLARLWEIANLDPERTRNSMSSQVKALSMIVAIEGLIPDRHSDRRAVSAQNVPAPPPPFYVSAWRRTQQDGETVDPQQASAWAQEEAAPAPPVSGPSPDATPKVTESYFPDLEPLANDVIAASRPHVRFVPDARGPFSTEMNPFGRRR